MKTIIVPTDFSSAAINAARYAADLALHLNAALLLFHVYQIPVAVTDNSMPPPDIEDLQMMADQKLLTHQEDLLRITGNKIEIKSESILGNVSVELEDIAARIKPFAVIMGTTGHSALERTLFGSNTLSAIKHLTWPVICVPSGKEFGDGFKKVGLACDFNSVAETTPVEAILAFMNEFDAEFHILNVHKGQPAPDQKPVEFLTSSFTSLKPTFHLIEHNDIEDGINEFADNNNLDLIITIPKKHRLLDNLFRKSSTKQLVFESHIPVMCVHE